MQHIAALPAGAKPVVWLLCGGPSSEYHVSLASAKTVLTQIDYGTFSVRLACIAPDGRWLVTPHAFFVPPHRALMDEIFALMAFPDTYPVALSLGEAMTLLEREHPVAAFNAMHGRVGEDGVVQGLMTMAGVPVTGSSVASSALAMDKVRSRLAFEAAGLTVPRAFTFTEQPGRPRPSGVDVDKRVGYPCFVKPASGGSSIGVSKVKFAKDLPEALQLALEDGPQIIIERGVEGIETTCGVLEDEHGEPRALMPTEIRPRHGEFFDFKSKYVAGEAEEITPARFDADTISCIRTASVMAHKALGCAGFSRADFILAPDARLFILEVNTLPGLTATSLLPQGAAAMGVSFASMVMRMLVAAMRRRKQLPFQITTRRPEHETPVPGMRAPSHSSGARR